MTKYLISFPGSAMDISEEDLAAVGEAARAVIREAKDAGVYVFGGGLRTGNMTYQELNATQAKSPQRHRGHGEERCYRILRRIANFKHVNNWAS